jgi:uncharacterized protein (TIGR02246 family)
MTKSSLITALTCLLLGSLHALSATAQEVAADIDRTVWSVISRTVVEYDIEAMAAVYHPDAVLVSDRGTVPISEALARWSQGMKDQQKRGATASVSFRFSSRLDAESTAFESGMFNYTEFDPAGNASPVYVPFEALLVKKDGRWLILMERQMTPADESAWTAMVPKQE